MNALFPTINLDREDDLAPSASRRTVTVARQNPEINAAIVNEKTRKTATVKTDTLTVYEPLTLKVMHRDPLSG